MARRNVSVDPRSCAGIANNEAARGSKMNKIDFDKINAALDVETCVRAWLPNGKRSGHNYFVTNPTRNDNNAGSFAVHLVTGKWGEFAGTDRGGDLVSLYAYLFHNNDNIAAAKELAQDNRIDMAAPMVERTAKVQSIDASQPKPVFPVPDNVPAPNFTHHEFGKPAAVYEYKNSAGKTLLYVRRFDPDGMRKQIIPLSWCEIPGKPARWAARGLSGADKRPIYGAEKLAANADADVIMVEGEKCADAGNALFSETAIVASWMGGVETSDRVSGLKLLAGRRVILFPDFDRQEYPVSHARAGQIMELHEQPGMRAMLNIASALKGIAREVLMVGYTPGANHAAGWDIADAAADGWSRDKMLSFIAKNSRDPWSAPKDNGVNMEASVNPFGFPHLSDKSQPMNTVENLGYLMGEYNISARYNMVRKLVEVTIPWKTYSLDNRANCSLSELVSICARNRMPSGMLAEYVKLIADGNKYNPVCDWIESRPWDGVERVGQLIATVRVKGDATLKNKLIYRWLISAVAALYKENFSSHGVLVFTGPQAQGKTSWIKSLVPKEFGVILEGAIVDPNNKDTVINAVSHWLVEMGELDATFRKADIARLKAFVTQENDKLRRPYDRIESEYRRSTVFFASVNESKYLVDDTGNRRWWTIPVSTIDYQHNIDMQQLWAELLMHFQAGEQHWLTDDERLALNALNEDHEAIDPVEETILKTFDWDTLGLVSTELTATEVLIMIGYDKPNKVQATHVSKVLKKLTGGDPIKRARGRYFAMPPKSGRGRGMPDNPNEPPL